MGMAKSTGFDVFNFRLQLHAKMTNDKLLAQAAVSDQSKLVFNSCMHRIKSSWNLDSEQAKCLIAYAYLHNPLHFEDISAYGKLNNIELSAPHYLNWKLKNRHDIRPGVNIMHLVVNSAPRKTVRDKFLNEYMADVDFELV